MSPIVRDLRERGCALQRDAMPVDDLASQAEQLFAMADAGAFAAAMNDNQRAALALRTMHFDFLLGQQPAERFVFAAIHRVLDSASWPVLCELFGPELCFPLRACAIRRQTPDAGDARLPYHQDVLFIGRHCLVVNHWTALTPSGGTAPGLELVARKLDDVIAPARRDAASAENEYSGYEIAGDAVDAHYGDDLITPVLAAGQSILFDQFTIHRTSCMPDMTTPRLSLELRVCNVHDYPLNAVHSRLICSTSVGRRALHICYEVAQL